MARSISAITQNVVLVCRKCSKKLGGGFGEKGDKPLAKELRKLAGTKNGRKSNLLVVETRCLKVCPKGAVVVVDAKAPDRWHLIPAQTDIEAVAEGIGIFPASQLQKMRE